MKTKLTIVAGLVVVLSLACVSVNAQTDEIAVKILPSAEKGMLKVFYAYHNDQPVQIKFSDAQSVLEVDYIQAANFENGFFKKYDISNIDATWFRIEIKSSKLSVTYKMVARRDGSYQPFLEKTTYNHDLVAVNN